MKIIDFRFRPSTPEYLSSVQTPLHRDLAALKGMKNFTVVPLEETVALMEQAGLDKAVINGRDVETTFNWLVTNDHIADCVSKYPDKFIGFGAVDPNKGMAAVYEVERCIKELGLKGMSIDPYMARRPANDRRFYPIYAKCAELNVPIMITSGPSPLIPNTIMYDASPILVDDVATEFPELTIIVAHGGYPWVTEMISVAQRHMNVYFDISAYELRPGANLYVEAANTLIPDRLLFGSAHPFTNILDSLKRYEDMPFTDEVREKVMYKNAARILGL